MRQFTILVFLLLIIQISFAQDYKGQDIINRANGLLKNKVGENVFAFYRFEMDSYYEYRDSGKTKWKKLKQNRKLKGKFLAAQICFSFHHPDYNYDFVNKFTYIMLDSLLNLTNEPFVDFIPDFIRNNQPSNWLSDSEIDKIIKRQNLKTTKYTIIKRLEFDTKSRKNKWVVINTLFEDDGYSEIEILAIDPVTGDVIEHKEEKQYVCK